MPTPYEVVTQRIIDALERGVVPWRQPWTATSHAPTNLISKRRYRGVNAVVTWSAGYADPWWLTFRQAHSLGGHIRKGEHGIPIMFFRMLDGPDEGEDVRDNDACVAASSTRRKGRRRSKDYRVPFIRYSVVFNVAQTDGLAAHIPQDHGPAIAPDAQAEALLEAWRQAPPIYHGFNHAAYSPRRDCIEVPARSQFDTTEDYYSTLFHEAAHATGHPSRLRRFDVDTTLAPFGSPDYSREELVAELAAAFLCGEVGLATTIESSAAYLQYWLRTLQGDRRLLVQAATDAQRAADHIRGTTPDSPHPPTRAEAKDLGAAPGDLIDDAV